MDASFVLDFNALPLDVTKMISDYLDPGELFHFIEQHQLIEGQLIGNHAVRQEFWSYLWRRDFSTILPDWTQICSEYYSAVQKVHLITQYPWTQLRSEELFKLILENNYDSYLKTHHVAFQKTHKPYFQSYFTVCYQCDPVMYPLFILVYSVQDIYAMLEYILNTFNKKTRPDFIHGMLALYRKLLPNDLSYLYREMYEHGIPTVPFLRAESNLAPYVKIFNLGHAGSDQDLIFFLEADLLDERRLKSYVSNPNTDGYSYTSNCHFINIILKYKPHLKQYVAISMRYDAMFQRNDC